MEFEDLPALWRARQTAASDPVPAGLAGEILERSRRLEALVRRRDRLETAVALAIAPFFAFLAVGGTGPLERTGAAILAASCLVIPVRLSRARRLFGTGPADRSTREFLSMERERLFAQRRLLRSVLWWYLAPLGVGVVLLFASRSSWQATGIYAVVVAALYGGIHALNQRAVTTEIDPRLRQVEELLQTLDEEPGT